MYRSSVVYTDDEDDEVVPARKSNKARLLDDTDDESDSELVVDDSADFKRLDDSDATPSRILASDDDKDVIESSVRSETGSSASSQNRSRIRSSPHGTSTPRKPVQVDESSVSEVALASYRSDSDVQEVSVHNEPLVISSDEEEAPPSRALNQSVLKQTNLNAFIQPVKVEPKEEAKTRRVVPEVYKAQLERVNHIRQELLRNQNAMKTIRLDTLPDKGQLLQHKARGLQTMLQTAERILEGMELVEGKNTNLGSPTGDRGFRGFPEFPGPIGLDGPKGDPIQKNAFEKVQVAWEQIEAGVGAVAPKTFGKKSIARFEAEKALTMDALGELHRSLANCPKEGEQMEAPRGLRVELMGHQRHGLGWLLWREGQRPSGGVLADDMGLGKTLTIIALVMKAQELRRDARESDKEEGGSDEERDDKENKRRRNTFKGGTLVVCPASLLNQWSGEVERRTKRGMLSVEHYHGAKREPKPKVLSEYDIVITTYSIVMNECERKGAIFRIKWDRIILDEAHIIRNHKSKTSEAVCALLGKKRWALTGTPVHNKELDMYALLKFIRCSPFDSLPVWKHWVNDKSTGGQERLHTVISSVMLRRTKPELIEKGLLCSMPERKWELISIKLEHDEREVYSRVLIFSRTLFAQFLHQRAQKNQDAVDLQVSNKPPAEANGEYFKMRKKLLQINRVKEVSQHEILVLLLRLRQICCHPSLITQMLQGNEDLGIAETEEEAEEINILEQLNKLKLDEEPEVEEPQQADGKNLGLKEASRGFLNPSQAVFSKMRISSKLKVVLDMVEEKIANGDKALIISQWTSLLNLIAEQLKSRDIKFCEINGSVPVFKRMPIVDDFNNPKFSTRIMLLSLTAGGVGLNLVGANHLFLMDLHWNPQLENQAQDRIYRMGQTKPVFIYKFLAVDTIEERIKSLQDNKLAIADAMLTGSKQVTNSKLSLQDLKMLFDM